MKLPFLGKSIFLDLSIITLLTISLCGCTPQSVTQKPSIKHSVLGESELNLIWVLGNVYTTQSDFQPAMSASAGVACFLGDTTYPPDKEISCINASGETVWQYISGTTNGILVSDGVYVTYGGRAGIEKFNLEGRLVWKQSLRGTGVVYAYLHGDQIQLFLHPERFIVLDSNSGRIIDTIQNEEIIFQASNERFVKASHLVSQSLDSLQINWAFEIKNKVRTAPLFTEAYVFLRTGRALGSIQTLDRHTGKLLWESEDNIISNLIFLPRTNQILALARDGKLLALDAKTGTSHLMLEFSETPFTLNGETTVGGYELAYDQETQVIYVLLGDSRQLFAFQLLK